MSPPPLFLLHRGNSALVVNVPHAGTYLPPDIAAQLTPVGRGLVDTDWHVDHLYEFVKDLDVTLMVATHARTVVDLNRPPSGEKLYPGQAETGICPTETFAGEALYDGVPPDAAEIATRVHTYWEPYHAALAAELARVRALHGRARLLDGHSIRARVPRLFDGTLPDLNFGTNGGAACAPALAARVVASAAAQGFSHVLNGRFRGGHITRQYGRPAEGVDAVQLEIAQSAYMDEDQPKPFDAARAAALVAILRRVVAELLCD